MDETFVRVRCHCGTSSFHVKFEQSRLPFSTSLCHCNTCRHVTGQMAFYGIPIDGPPLVGTLTLRPVDLNTTDLTGYAVSPSSTRYFCPNCSAKMFLRNNNINSIEWLVAGGILESTEGIIKLVSHINVEDTMDGGLADQIRIINGKTLARYAHNEGSKELPVGWRSKELKTREEAMAEEKLHAYCHCGAVNIYITRPNELSAVPYAPYPDMLHPHHMRLYSLLNPKDEKWWLSPSLRSNAAGQLVAIGGTDEDYTIPSAKTKYLGGHCVCEHCRLGSGFEIQSYAFFSRANVFEEGSEEPIEFFHEENRPKGLKQYCSSPGRYREFCGTCGATAFWWHIGRPDVIDVSVGLLDELDDGVRAEEWLNWVKKRLAFMEKALSSPRKALVQGLADGLNDITVHGIPPTKAEN